jgi:8-oxo-dGTP pyrophosphatase MutT (NUDIX family)
MSKFSNFLASLRSRLDAAGRLAAAAGVGEFVPFEGGAAEASSGTGAASSDAGITSSGAGVASSGTLRQAAVALVLRSRLDEPELLVIKRSETERDHWSGHLALPGGRVEPEDESLLVTATRETFEEVGIDLCAGGDVLGRLGTVTPQSPLAPRVSVTPFVAVAPPRYHVDADGASPALTLSQELTLSEEVAAAFWVPVAELKSDGRSGVFKMEFAGVERAWPAYPSPHGMIWGITERILTEFLSLVD